MKTRFLFALLLGCPLLGGCVGMLREGTASRSSLVEFLYPETAAPVVTPGIPRLELPLRVGVAFTPAQVAGNAGLSEAAKQRLAQDVAREFAALDFIDTIEIIPSDYLRQQGGFPNLDQLRSLFGVDVIVLLSYDQSTFTSEGLASLTYWTIVGAYIVPGEKNDTQTLIDAAVYDIPSRMLLFRAPGTSVIKSRSTLVGNTEQLRDDGMRGFDEAGAQLKQNLAAELGTFKQRVKDTPQSFAVTTREGYTGSGSNEGIFLLMVVLGICAIRRSGE
jgi:rhombotail lipoprotein